jgi:hypothetical protein
LCSVAASEPCRDTREERASIVRLSWPLCPVRTQGSAMVGAPEPAHAARLHRGTSRTRAKSGAREEWQTVMIVTRSSDSAIEQSTTFDIVQPILPKRFMRFSMALDRPSGSSPQMWEREPESRRVCFGNSDSGFFSLPQRKSFPNFQRLDLTGLIGRARSASYVPKSGAAGERVLTLLRALHERYADGSGFVTLVYDTEVFCSTRL